MPNTVHGPFAPITVVQNVTPMNATLGNLIQTQSAIALAGFNPDLIAACVITGITCTKDGTTANQLDIASGHAYLVMTDGTVARIDVVTDNTHTTSTPSTTYHLYLQPDGTWYWSTSNTPAANSLHICDVTTDGSSNILAVTDQRVLGPLVAAGGLLFKRGAGGVLGTLAPGDAVDVDSLGSLYLKAASGRSITFQIPNGNTVAVMGSNGGFLELAGQMTAGNFGMPVMIGQGLAVSVTNTSAKTIVSYTTPNDGHNHIIRPTCQFNIGSGNTNFGTITVSLQFTDPFVGAKNNALFRDGDTSGLAGVSLARDTWFTGHQPVLCGPNTTILIAYTNAAAGTINDTVWATLELLS